MKLIYRNGLSSPESVGNFRLEGQASITFPEGRLRMENVLDPEDDYIANYVYWCPEDFPANIQVQWDFWPIREPGLCMLFFAASGQNGEDLFDPRLSPRTGEYGQYTYGDIRTMHISYFRRRYPDERAFHTCNLRKSPGFHLVAQGADPIPDVEDCRPPYHLKLVKRGGHVTFAVNDLQVLDFDDSGVYGPVLTEGKIGFRQMAPLIGEYADLRVYDLGVST